MRIRLIWVNRTKLDYLREAIKDFIERLNHYCKLEVIEIKRSRYNKNVNVREVKSEEGLKIIKNLDFDSFIIALDVGGKSFTSEEFAKIMKKSLMESGRDATFVIGGAYGLSPLVLKRTQLKLSLSPMTLSHQLIRIVLLEQIYRAFCIMHNRPYHK